MDVEGRREFWKAIRDDASVGRTVLFATHYLEEADAYADRIVLISQGRIVADGTAAEVKGLVSGRTIRATLAGAEEDMLAAIPGVDGVKVRGDTILIHSADADTVARTLLNETAAHDPEITSRGLEDAFLALTSDGARTDPRPERGSHVNNQSTLAAALERKAPPMGGFRPAIVRLEVRRLLRNRRTVIFTLLLPVVFLLAFGLNSGYDTHRIGHGNESAFVMISFGLYGAVFATTSGGAMVSVERVWG